MTDSKIIPLPDLKQIEEEAARWIVRLEDGDATAQEQAEFRTWYAQSVQHRTSIEHLNKLWGGLDILDSLNDIAVSGDIQESLKQRTHRIEYPVIRRVAAWSIAVSIAILAIGTSYQLNIFSNPNFEATYETAIGEQEVVNLPDGSKIILNTDSVARVKYSHSAPDIYIASGETFFDVAKDKSKPFTVRTKKHLVTAVGTAFSVSLLNDQVEVVVTEGRVVISSVPLLPVEDRGPSEDITQAPETLIEVTAGQSVTSTRRIERIDKIEPEAIEQILDWRDGIISFTGEPLEEVIASISPYTSLTIEIDGEGLKQQPIGGYFKVGETVALFEALKLMANIKTEYMENGHIRLYRDESEIRFQ